MCLCFENLIGTNRLIFFVVAQNKAYISNREGETLSPPSTLSIIIFISETIKCFAPLSNSYLLFY